MPEVTSGPVRGDGMRTMRVGAVVLALALLAVACGDDDDDDDGEATGTTQGGEATTTVADDATTTTAGEDPATTAATDEPDEHAGGVTVDESGRLVPATCPEGTANADPDLGVTETTVNVATLGIDYAPLADIGFAASGSDIREFLRPFVDDLNARGGICGRTIDYQGVNYDILNRGGGAGCVEVTGDRRNAIVLVQAGTPEAVCVAEAGTIAFSQHDFAAAEVAAVEDLMFMRNPEYSQQIEATTQWALDNDLLQGQAVGVWYGSIYSAQGDAVEAVVLPMLDEAGIDYQAFRTDAVGPSDPEGSAVLQTAATAFTSAGIDVLLNFTANTNHTGIKGELAAQGGLPPVLLSAPVSGNTANTVFQRAFAVEEISDGERITSYLYTPEEEDKGAAAPPLDSCLAQYEELTGTAIEPNTFDHISMANMCHQFDMVVAALSVVGPELTQEGLVAAIESLPPHPMGAGYAFESFADGHFSSAGWGVHLYDGSTNTYSTIETFEFPG